MTNFKTVQISQIEADPNQPRKFFDDSAMTELTQSVKEKGVLQPILLRPVGNQYLLVCGERRFRASAAAGLSEIPAVIRELTDDEALELQIIENLQRKDVHPMEEAVAFKSLIDGKQWSVQEVATRVSKKDFYVRQRLKLNDLVPDWQQLFYKNKFTLTEALQLCLLPEKAQQEFYKNEVANAGSSNFSFNDYRLKQYKGDLQKATFDLSDPTLDRKMGPCTTCQFNTAVSLLFPENASSPRCMNVPCFKHKSDVFFDWELKKVKDDPEVIFISSGYSSSSKIVEQLKKEGHPVLKEYNDFKEISAPEKPDWEEWKDDQLEEGDDIEEITLAFSQVMADYEKEKAAFDKKTASGKYKKAFEVEGYHPGKFTFIELKAATGKQAAKAAVDSGAATVSDIDAEIQRIKDREKRSKELDAEKVHVLVVSTLKDHSSMKSADLLMTDQDRVLMRFLIHEHLDYSIREDIRKKTGLKEQEYHSSIQQRREWFAKLGQLTDNQVAYILRKILLSKYSSQLPQNIGGTALRILAESLGDINIGSLEAAQQEIASKREARVNVRLEDLQTQRKDLQAASKPKKSKASASK